MFLLGAALGSFLCCQARRLRLKEKGKRSLGTRSVCLSCGHQLSWYENIPILSWLALRGKCKKCHHKIGYLEILSELGVALAFLAVSAVFIRSASVSTAASVQGIATPFGSFSPYAGTMDFLSIGWVNWVLFLITLVLILSLSFLAIYDGKWGELPSLCLTFSAICAIILVILRLWSNFSVTTFSWSAALAPLVGAAVFGGIYFILYIVSHGRWVGDGDWLLGGIIGLALGTPWLALIALFIANFSAILVTYPAVRHQKHAKIYFGPFLVLAFVITFAFSEFFSSLL